MVHIKAFAVVGDSDDDLIMRFYDFDRDMIRLSVFSDIAESLLNHAVQTEAGVIVGIRNSRR